MTKRQIVLERCRVAGYEGDTRALVRIYVECGRLASWVACQDAFRIGVKQRERKCL